MTKCVAIEKDGKYQNFGEVVVKLVDVIGLYNTCAARHNALVDYENGKAK